MKYLPDIGTFVLSNAGLELRVQSATIKHNSQGDLYSVEYTIYDITNDKIFTLPSGHCNFQIMFRGKSVKRILLVPDDDPKTGLVQDALPNVIVSDFLRRVLNPNYVHKETNIIFSGFEDKTWQEHAVASGHLPSFRFLPRYMKCHFQYSDEDRALKWHSGEVFYVCMSEPNGKMTIGVDYDQYVHYIDSDKRALVSIQMQ